MFTQLRTNAVSALGLRPMSPLRSPASNWLTSVGVSNIPRLSITNKILGRVASSMDLYSATNSTMVLATSSIMAMFNFINLSSEVSTPKASSQSLSKAFSVSINIGKMPDACAFLTKLPAQIKLLPAPDSPANTVTLPRGIPL